MILFLCLVLLLGGCQKNEVSAFPKEFRRFSDNEIISEGECRADLSNCYEENEQREKAMQEMLDYEPPRLRWVNLPDRVKENKNQENVFSVGDGREVVGKFVWDFRKKKFMFIGDEKRTRKVLKEIQF